MNLYKLLGVITMSTLLLPGCTPKQVTKQEVIPSSQTSQMRSSGVDTLLYTIDFPDNTERDKFIKKFREFINTYPFAKIEGTGFNRVQIKINPSQPASVPFAASSGNENFTTTNQQFTDNTFTNQVPEIVQTGKDTIYTQYQTDTGTPVTGGSLRLYTQRSFADELMLSLLSTYPFDKNGVPGVLTISEQSARRLTIRINGKITNGKGKVLSALDLIDSWTNLVKAAPAEGFALFRQVEGMREFIDGREAVIRGLVATDQNTIQLRLVQPDPDIVDRVSTSRLLGSSIKMGLYYDESVTADEKSLLANKIPGRKGGYLDKLVVKHGGDVNPVLSFSLKKFDAIELLTISDLNYAKANLAKAGKVDIIAKDRYFVSINVKEVKARQYLSSLINPQEILKNFVKAEGECIASIETNVPAPLQIAAGAVHPGMIQPVKVLFRKDDPVSKIIAEKLIADFSKGNIPCALSACSMQEYEKALVSRNFGCAVGWVSDDILSDKSEKIRCATMWFTDILDEKVRIESFSEMPLFSVNRYLLFRNSIGIPYNKIQNIFINPANGN